MKYSSTRQQGFVMVTAIVFLLVLTLLAITAVRRATQDEKFANSMRAQNLAFQAAETALRYCQKDLDKTNNGEPLGPGVVQTVSGIPVTDDSSVAADAASKPVLWKTTSNWSSKGFTLPNNTVPGVAQQPKCMIETYTKTLANKTYTIGGKNAGAGMPKLYQITAVGYGISNLTEIWLQVTIYFGAGTT